MRVVAVMGTRPEVIKLAPVVAELRRRSSTDVVLVSTGQHREMLDQMLDVFGLVPDVELDVMRRDQQLSALTSELMRGLGATLDSLRPDWVLVQGDTTTTLCGALAGFYAGVPVGHVEAGLRSGDNQAPFPEEGNRRLVTPLARLHFCPTTTNARNLLAEAVPAEHVHVTGNTVIDALHWAVERARDLTDVVPRTRPRRILLTAHRRESHGAALHDICVAVRRLAARGDVEIVFPVHRSPVVREMVARQLAGVPGINLCEPLDYLSLVNVLDSCDLVLTDSGGLQEEGPALGKPVLVLRDTTERPEAVDAGVAQLVGTNAAHVYEAAARLLDDPVAYALIAHPENPFGDGRASRRIVEALVDTEALARAA
jgi:UDP-N-acetylglucosamine 2-epimerase (non-hydrolysing)